MANNEVRQNLHGGQGQVGGLQVPLLGHGNDTQTQIGQEGEWGQCGCFLIYLLKEMGTRMPASLGGMSHPLLPLL